MNGWFVRKQRRQGAFALAVLAAVSGAWACTPTTKRDAPPRAPTAEIARSTRRTHIAEARQRVSQSGLWV